MPAIAAFTILAVIPPVVFNAARSAGMTFAVRNVSTCTFHQSIEHLTPSHVRDIQYHALLNVSKIEQQVSPADIMSLCMELMHAVIDDRMHQLHA